MLGCWIYSHWVIERTFVMSGLTLCSSSNYGKVKIAYQLLISTIVML